MKNTFAELAAKHKLIQEQVHHGASISSLRSEIDTIYAECRTAKYEEGIARCERYFSALLDQEGKIDEAVKLNAKVKRFAKKKGIGDLARECVFFECARLFREDKKKCYIETSKLLKSATEAEDKYFTASCLFLLGLVTMQFGLDSEAIEKYKDGLSVSRQNRYGKIQGNILMQLAELFLSKLQYDYAEKYARECIGVYSKANDKTTLQTANIRLVTILLEKNEIKESAKILADISKGHILGATHGTLLLCEGKLLAKKGKYNDARKQFSNAIDIFISAKRERLVCNTWGIISETFIEEKSGAESLKYANQMLQIAERISDSYHITHGYRLLYQGYKLSGDALNALDYLEKYNERVKKDEEQLLTTRIEFIELQKDYEMKQAEAESERQRSSLLQIELEHKEKELTEKTRHLIKQTDALTQFRDDLRSIIRRSPSDDPLVKEIKERLKEVPESQLKWEVFDEQFSLVHPVFLKKLLEKHPTLTKMEQKICTLLRLNMTSVDIAKLLYLSERNIENHRYRIRKKIALDSEVSLHEYLGRV